MTTIKEILQGTFLHKKWWNYYGDFFPQDIFSSDSNGCKDFVKKFFNKSGKAELFCCAKSLGHPLSTERWEHIVYVFLLGIYVYRTSSYKKTIDEEIDKLKKRLNGKSDIEFAFIWFLICLSHDLFCSSENDLQRLPFLDTEKYKLRGIYSVPKLFRKLPIRYYFYRRLQGKNDHGVYAGLKMYRKLCNIRKEQKKYKNSCSPDSPLNWDKSLEKVYNYAAWIVTCHNMWFMHDDEKDEASDCTLYKSFGLDELILSDNGEKYKKECRKYPIFRLFCIIDTIEVIKKVGSEELENIGMDVTENTITIDVSKSKEKEKLKDKIMSLNSWIVDVQGKEDYTFKINL